MLIRYSRWDGSQGLPDLDADAVLDEMADDLLSHGDLRTALQRLLRQGMQPPEGRKLPGLKDFLERLRQNRQQRLDRYDLGSSLDDIKRRLDDVIRTEREGLERRLTEMREGAQRGDVPPAPARKFERLAARNREALDALPPDPAGRIR
ncbi:MAG: VWA domain-containing protein, partial [Candidatus Limnocylindria bacterium]